MPNPRGFLRRWSSFHGKNLLPKSVPKTALVGGFLKTAIADGTAAKTDVTVTGMAVGDELVAVLALTTKADIATMANRTSEYAIGAGKLTKADGTDETGNQLLIIYLDLT